MGSRRPAVLSLPEVPLDLDETPGAEQFERINDTQVRYRPMSQVNPTGAVVPATMAAATWSALQGLQERVGDIDAWLCGRLRWSIKELGTYLTSEQVDGVALALDAADRQEGLVIADMTGFGKGRSQPLDAQILTPSGWRRMGDIAVGDEVMAVDGKPTPVTGVFPQGEIDTFEVAFSDGAKTRCSADHLWATLTRSQRFERKHNPDSIYSEYKIRNTSDLGKKLTQIHSIPLASSICFPARDVLVDPYLMGAALGDGNIRKYGLSLVMAESEVLAEVEAALPSGFIARKVTSRDYHYDIVHEAGRQSGLTKPYQGITNPVVAGFRSYGLSGKTAADKFVPDDYLFNTSEVRHAVLQGLMDTDAEATPNGTSVFSSASIELARGVAFLARSLGGTAIIAPPRKTRCLPSYRVTIRLPNGLSPFRLARKSNRVPTWSKYPPCRYIKSIVPAGRAECQCISIAHPTRLYVTDDFIVTHNTIAATARAVALSGRNVVFLTEKANLFSDFWRDIRDIGSEKVFGRPFMLNDGAKMVDTSSEAGQVIVPPWKKSEVDRILRSGALPEGSRLMMATYSQFNRKGTRKVEFLERVSNGGHVMLDEAHNFVGDSTTSKTVGAAVAAAGGSTFSSATFARDVGNLAAYSSVFPWLSRITGLEEMTPAQRRALAEESVRLATASGRIIRREHDLTNMVLRISTETGGRAQTNRALADNMAPVLSRMAKLARRVDAILLERNEVNRQHLETMTSADERKAAREVWLTANFGSRLSAVLQQFLVALNVDPCVEMCVESLLSGSKPVVVIESTMESLMRELSRDVEADEVEPGAGQGDDAQGALDLAPATAPAGDDADEGVAAAGALPRPDARPPTFREALMVLADRLLRVSVRRGAAYEKEAVVLDEPGLAEARDEIMEMASTFPDLSLSPIDDLRDRVEAEGRRLYALGRIPRPWAADEISARGMRVVDGRYVSMPSADRNQIVARFVNGSAHMLVLTQAASTGLSIHDSEKFADHARRHMIELSPPRNVLARIQMWGRVWRRGQLTEPEFSVLDTGLPFHSYDLAARNRKLRELSASVTGTSRATVSLDVPDPIDLVGNEVAHDLLQEQQSLAEAMGISLNVDKDEADRELYFVGKLFRRLPLLTTERQEKVCAAFYAAYEDRLRNGADVQAGRHLEGRWTPVKREMLDPGDGTDDPVTGRDVTVTTLRSYRHARPMQHADVMAMADAARATMSVRNPMSAHVSRLQEMAPAILQAALPRKGYSSVRQALGAMGDNPVKRAQAKLADMDFLLKALAPGIAARLPGEDDEMADGIISAVRMPPVERANIAREYEIHFVVPGDEQPRTMSLDALLRERRTGLSTREAALKMQAVFDEAPRGDVAVERKVLDGGGIGAVLASRRVKSGTRITYTDDAGRSRSGILLSRAVARRIAGAPARTNMVEVAQHVLERGGKLQTDFASPADGVEIRPETGGGIRVVIPGSKRAAKGFETLDMLELTGPFEGDFRERSARVAPARAAAVLELLVRKGHEFNFDGTLRAAAIERTREVIEASHGMVPRPEPAPRP